LAEKLSEKIKKHTMKSLNFLSMVIALVLVATAVSCTTLQGGYDDEYYSTERRTPNRIYVDDPYYGTIVLEKDPYSGRYYQVSPYGYSYGYNNRTYRGYNNRYRDYYYRNNRSNNSGSTQQQTEQQRKDSEKREEARKKVLGR
jgi:hypothetical protein